jgi:hypothetical protein
LNWKPQQVTAALLYNPGLVYVWKMGCSSSAAHLAHMQQSEHSLSESNCWLFITPYIWYEQIS